MAAPLPRFGHVAAHCNGRLLVWGGSGEHDHNIPASCIEVCASGQWRTVPTTGTPPLAAHNSTNIAVGSSVYHFGGRSDTGRSNKLHELDSALMEWVEVHISNTSDGPTPKGHCSIVKRGEEELAVIGGWPDDGFYTNEVHYINPREGIWYSPTVSGDIPPPCYGFSLVNIDEFKAVLYGGNMEGQGWSSDVYYIDLRVWRFEKVVTRGRLRPNVRQYHAAVIIGGPQHPQLLIIGGWGFTVLADAWVANLGQVVTWSEVVLPSGVGTRYLHTATVLSNSRRSALVLVHGGRRTTTVTSAIHLEADATEGPPQWRAVEVVTMEDRRRWRGLFDDLQKLEQLQSLLRTKKTIRSKAACMVFNGPPRTGKSTAIHRLVRDISAVVPALHLPSTPILERPLRVGIKKLTPTRAAVKGGNSTWVEQTIQDERQRTLRRSLPLAEAMNTLTVDTNTTQTAEKGPPQDPAPRKALTTEVGSTAQHLQLTDSAPTLGTVPPSLFQDSLPSFDAPDDIMRMALQSLGALKDSEDLDNSTIIHIFDCGGQPAFQVVARLMLLKPTITVQFFNLSIGLKERYDVWYESQDGQTTNLHRSTFTVEEVLLGTQSSLAFLDTKSSPSELPFEAKPFQSKSIFVGTHLDLVSEEDVSRIDDTLQKQLKCSAVLYDKVVYYPNPHTSSHNVVIPIDNTKANDPGIIKLQELVNKIIEELPSSDLPISWEWFKLSVLSTEAKTMTVSQCVVIGRASGMEGRGEVLLALWYHTNFTGLIQHHDIPGIKEIVWLDPQLISDGMTVLISSTFHRKGPVDRKQVMYQETGRFPVAEVRKILEQCCREVPCEKLIILFQHLHVFSPVTNKEGEIIEYFVPCVLRPAEVESIQRITASASHPAPLLFIFSTGFVPVGVFHALVVHLSLPVTEPDSLQWELCTSGSSHFCNKVSFVVGEDFDEVTLIDRPQFLEVWIDREDETNCSRPLADICCEVRSTLDSTLTQVKSSRNSTLKVSHHAAFYCQRTQCDPLPHYALPRGNPPKSAKCSITQCPCRVGPYKRIWFDKHVREVNVNTATAAEDRILFQGGSQLTSCPGRETGIPHSKRPCLDTERPLMSPPAMTSADTLSSHKQTHWSDDHCSQQSGQSTATQLVAAEDHVLTIPQHSQHDRVFTEIDLPVLMRKMSDSAYCAFDLGVQLGLSSDIVRTLEDEALRHPTKFLCLVLSRWINCRDPPPTLHSLISALTEPPIRNEVLARDIQDTFL